MIDYGALQPSPVQKPNDSSRAPETPLVASSLSPQEHHQHVNCLASFFFPLHADPLASASPLSPTLPIRHLAARFLPGGYTPDFSWNTPPAVQPLEADETFNLDSFDLTNEELEAMMMNATQEFWASFPGEVGVGY